MSEKAVVEQLWDAFFVNGCNTTDYPLYNADYFNSYCLGYAACFRYYDSACEAKDATRVTEWNLRIINAIGVGVPLFVTWMSAGLVGIPFLGCLWATTEDYNECSFGLLGDQMVNGGIQYEDPFTEAEKAMIINDQYNS